MAHIDAKRGELLARIKRISGQVAAIERQLSEDVSCSELLQLVAGTRGAINGLMDEIIVDHLEAHVLGEQLSQEERSAGAAELMAVIRRYAK
ncbi:MAG: metal/formaldehyde-sensitive transcriptional repressor [Sphingomonadales bacterium]|nr:metal/formaldehyde-sensitive transcriptional repressor [Sphingomonadales bacterium]